MAEFSSTPSQSIDQVIEHLDGVVQWARSEQSRLGFFAALYRRVTVAVKEGISSGRFQDGLRMERLDVVFANRYLTALQQFQQEDSPSNCWLMSFQSASRGRLLVLQHLLLGMNAHINLDLGIAAAQTSPGAELPSLKRDFDEITILLAELFDDVQQRIGTVSPALGLLDRLGGRTDEVVGNFSMNKAREAAWKVAEDLVGLSPGEQEEYIAHLDRNVSLLSHFICHPGLKGTAINQIIRLFEQQRVPAVLDALG